MITNTAKFRLGAVSYLNTSPLVWGMLHGPQREQVDLSFSLPAVCAREVEEDKVRIGLVPVAEMARQSLEIVPGVGIACHGAVRSILLFSRVPWPNVRTLAADSSSRTSVELARVILRERFGVVPTVTAHAPQLESMLAAADAALIIGDPALRIAPGDVSYHCLDLGEEWLKLTGLPMVFALWAGKPGLPARLEEITRGSYGFGKERIAQIVESEFAARQITRDLAERYLKTHIRFEIGREEMRGLEAFFELADLPMPYKEQHDYAPAGD